MLARTLNAAVEDLLDAFERVGISAELAGSAGTHPLVMVTSGARKVMLAVVSAAAPSPSALREIMDRVGRPSHRRRPVVPILVATRISAPCRELLVAKGWGWLDRRGNLRLVDADSRLFIDMEISRLAFGHEAGGDPLSTTVGLEVAVQLLLEPTAGESVRSLARELGRAPSSVSVALRGLRRQSLVGGDNQPHLGALFETVAGSWSSRATSLASNPEIDIVAGTPRFGAGFDDLEDAGWALTDSLAAVAWGARLALHADYPPDLYVPEERVVVRAVERFGQASTEETRAARLLVPPVQQAVRGRSPAQPQLFTGARWPLAHPLFVALELAQDPGRGAEILRSWTPRGFHRVW